MATMIVTNGPIYTLDPQLPRVDAIGIRDGVVCVAGSRADVDAVMGTPEYTLDLQGHAVIPGLTDAHVHIISHGLTLRQVALDGIADFETVLGKIAAAHAQTPGNSWLQGFGWDHTLWGGRWPTADDLAWSPSHHVAQRWTLGMGEPHSTANRWYHQRFGGTRWW